MSAVPFITSGGEGDGDAAEGGDTTLRVNEEALEVLRKISGPISVVSVVGLYRTGKSFLVNRIVGRQKGSRSGRRSMPAQRGYGFGASPYP